MTETAILTPARADASAKPTRPPVAPASGPERVRRSWFRGKTGYLMVAPYLLHLALFLATRWRSPSYSCSTTGT